MTNVSLSRNRLKTLLKTTNYKKENTCDLDIFKQKKSISLREGPWARFKVFIRTLFLTDYHTSNYFQKTIDKQKKILAVLDELEDFKALAMTSSSVNEELLNNKCYSSFNEELLNNKCYVINSFFEDSPFCFNYTFHRHGGNAVLKIFLVDKLSKYIVEDSEQNIIFMNHCSSSLTYSNYLHIKYLGNGIYPRRINYKTISNENGIVKKVYRFTGSIKE
jgi:hypothetical protein